MTSLGEIELPDVEGKSYDFLASVSVRDPRVFGVVDSVMLGGPLAAIANAKEGRSI